MPLMFAFVASALLHVAALVGPGWILPGEQEFDPPPTTLDATIARPATPAEAPTPARPAKPAAAKPRTPRATPPADAAQTMAEPPAEAVVPQDTPSAVPPPAAVPPAPTVAAPVARTPVQTSLPGRGEVRYIITRGEGGLVVGRSVYSWEHDGVHYRLKNLTETTGLAALFKPAQAFQTSIGEVTENGLQPQEFRQERTSVGIELAQFDWLRRIVAVGGREEPLANGTQDILSMYYQLVLLAPRSGALEMPIVTGRRMGLYRWDVIGEESLSFPRGERRTVRIGTRSGNDNIELWLPLAEGTAPRSLPLKIRFTDRKGEIYDQLMEESSQEENK